MSDTIRLYDAVAGEPNFDLLREHGWAVAHARGRYCVAWRGAEEVTFVWAGDRWQQLPPRSSRAAA